MRVEYRLFPDLHILSGSLQIPGRSAVILPAIVAASLQERGGPFGG